MDKFNTALIAYGSDGRERCGYIINDQIVEMENVSAVDDGFEMIGFPDGVQAVWHTHPPGSRSPSEADMIGQYASAVPWAVVVDGRVFWFGDGLPIPDLFLRGFRHGVTDCYDLIRDSYAKAANVTLPNFPREWGWWSQGRDLYGQGFKDAGFKEIELGAARPGDVFLLMIGAKVCNHGVLYLGDEIVFHHPCPTSEFDAECIPRIESAHPYVRFIKQVLTHEDDHLDRQAFKKIRLGFQPGR